MMTPGGKRNLHEQKIYEVIRRLVKELADLNAEQRDAVRYPENIVVCAGPGAAKTRSFGHQSWLPS